MQESTKIMETKIDVFNKNHSVGSIVFVVKDNGDKVKTTVKYPACIMGGHTAVAWLNGIIGAYALDRVIT